MAVRRAAAEGGGGREAGAALPSPPLPGFSPHGSLPACVAGLLRELLREEAPGRIAALTEELFRAAGSLGGEAGAEPEVGPGPAASRRWVC